MCHKQREEIKKTHKKDDKYSSYIDTKWIKTQLCHLTILFETG